MTFRFYRSVRIGDGLTLRTAFRNKLSDPPYAILDNPGAGTGFWDWVHDARPVRYSLVACDSTLHATIESDAEIIPLSPELADATAVQAWLDGALSGAPAAVTNRLESDGISISWVAAQTTRREAFRYASVLHVCTQDLRRLKDADSLAFFANALDAKVNTLPVQARTKAAAWMQGKGLDTSWIVPSTTSLRQVIHYVIQNVAWPVMPFGPHRL